MRLREFLVLRFLTVYATYQWVPEGSARFLGRDWPHGSVRRTPCYVFTARVKAAASDVRSPSLTLQEPFYPAKPNRHLVSEEGGGRAVFRLLVSNGSLDCPVSSLSFLVLSHAASHHQTTPRSLLISCQKLFLASPLERGQSKSFLTWRS